MSTKKRIKELEKKVEEMQRTNERLLEDLVKRSRLIEIGEEVDDNKDKANHGVYYGIHKSLFIVKAFGYFVIALWTIIDFDTAKISDVNFFFKKEFIGWVVAVAIADCIHNFLGIFDIQPERPRSIIKAFWIPTVVTLLVIALLFWTVSPDRLLPHY